jgi:hypothetical protein
MERHVEPGVQSSRGVVPNVVSVRPIRTVHLQSLTPLPGAHSPMNIAWQATVGASYGAIWAFPGGCGGRFVHAGDWRPADQRVLLAVWRASLDIKTQKVTAPHRWRAWAAVQRRRAEPCRGFSSVTPALEHPTEAEIERRQKIKVGG